MSEKRQPHEVYENPPIHPITMDTIVNQFGMTIRDHFAGLAMQGLIARGREIGVEAKAYEIADAMLAERKKGRAR